MRNVNTGTGERHEINHDPQGWAHEAVLERVPGLLVLTSFIYLLGCLQFSSREGTGDTIVWHGGHGQHCHVFLQPCPITQHVAWPWGRRLGRQLG